MQLTVIFFNHLSIEGLSPTFQYVKNCLAKKLGLTKRIYPIYRSSSVPYIVPSESLLMGHLYTSLHWVDFISGMHVSFKLSSYEV